MYEFFNDFMNDKGTFGVTVVVVLFFIVVSLLVYFVGKDTKIKHILENEYGLEKKDIEGN